MEERKRVLLADGAMFTIAIFWGSGFGVTTWLLGYLSPLWLLTARFVLSSIILLIFFRKRLRFLGRRDVMLGCLLGLLLSITFVAHIMGLVFTTPGKQSFIASSNVVMVPFLFALFYKKWPSIIATAGAFLTTAGLLIMAFTPGLTFNFGDFLSLILAFGIALHVLAVGNLSRRMDPVALTVVQLFTATVLLSVSAAVFEPFPDFAAVAPKALWGILYVVVFVTVIPFLVQTVAQRFSPEVHAAILLSLEGPFGYLIAVFIGQEVLNLQVVLGGGVIVAGVLLAECDTFLRKAFHLPGRTVAGTGEHTEV
ncbi:MAG: DMT family transporter [Thermovirgaceae bacterium]|nr:DMT family transporter [Thermovirgaceae bacterium]